MLCAPRKSGLHSLPDCPRAETTDEEQGGRGGTRFVGIPRATLHPGGNSLSNYNVGPVMKEEGEV